MRLIKVELIGFKSFCEKTVLYFDKGITSIVGPNGSGKSNIVDAILWTLGERGTKSLRIKEMEDVIFHGSNGKRSVNMAEVTILFSDENDEYSIKRRIFRDGTSEYFINGNQVRLKDIQDFFLGSGIGPLGYAIIEQGRIESFVHMKPQERKIIIEEAGGITRFKEKKEDAVSRLEEVRSNLERVEDVLGEIENSLKKAEIELERWKTYKALMEKKSNIEKDILLCGHTRLKRNLERMNERLERIRKKLSEKEEQEKSLEEMLRIKEDEISLNERKAKEIEILLSTKERDSILKLKEIELRREKLKELVGKLNEARKKLENSTKRLTELKMELETLESSYGHISFSLENRISKMERLKNEATTIREEIPEIETRLERTRGNLFDVVTKLTEVNNKLVDLERKIKERKERQRRLNEERATLEERIISLKKKISELRSQIESKSAILVQLEKISSELEKKIHDLRGEIAQREKDLSLIQAEKKAKEEYLRKLKLFKEERASPKNLKKLFELIKGTESINRILETHFLRELDSYVVEDKEIMEILSHLRAGNNYIFFHEKGIFKRKEDGVEVEIRVCSDKREALERVLRGEEGLFASDDALIDSRGLILMKKEENFDIKAQKEKAKTKEEILLLEDKLRLCHDGLLSLQNECRELSKELETKKQRIKMLNDELTNLDRERLITEARLREAEEKLKRLSEFEKENLFDDDESEPERYQQLIQKKETLSKTKDQIEREIVELKRTLTEKKGLLESISENLKKEEIEIEKERTMLSTIELEKKSNTRQVAELEAVRKTASNEIQQLEADLAKENRLLTQLQAEHEKLKKECEEKERELEELKARFLPLYKEREAIAKELNSKRTEIEKQRGHLFELEKETLLISEKKKEIEEIIRSKFGIDPNRTKIDLQPESQLEKERLKVEKEIESLGEINFRAEKDYIELKERIEFLERQKEDLKGAAECLKRTISKIDTVSKEIFFETLERINEKYKALIKRLFLGGDGYLRYNPETDGVEMFARPPGKKITKMEMLSGGEKALVSLALLLALIQVNPPPFCLMDEIDAPLDEANLSSLLEILKDMSKETQIIFVTHNRLTMEISNTIYGITMEEDGVSKVVSVRLNNFSSNSF